MNGKVVDKSKVEIYINKVIDTDKVFSKIKSISMKKDSSGNIIPCTNVDYEAHFDYHGGINFVDGGYKIVCDSDFIKVMKSLTYPRIISRNEINNLRKNMINDLNDTFKDSGKDMIISCDNGEFPQKSNLCMLLLCDMNHFHGNAMDDRKVLNWRLLQIKILQLW